MTPRPEQRIPLDSLTPGDVIEGPFGRYEFRVGTVGATHVTGSFTKTIKGGYSVGSLACYPRRDWKDGTALLVRRYPGLAGRGGEA